MCIELLLIAEPASMEWFTEKQLLEWRQRFDVIDAIVKHSLDKNTRFLYAGLTSIDRVREIFTEYKL